LQNKRVSVSLTAQGGNPFRTLPKGTTASFPRKDLELLTYVSRVGSQDKEASVTATSRHAGGGNRGAKPPAANRKNSNFATTPATTGAPMANFSQPGFNPMMMAGAPGMNPMNNPMIVISFSVPAYDGTCVLTMSIGLDDGDGWTAV
jgi:hypothetical protein